VPIFAAVIVPVAGAQHRHGRHEMAGDPAHAADMQVFHRLLEHRAEIRRQVTNIPGGVDTLTESDAPEIAALLQQHVDAMIARVKEGRGIHLRDPLFREIFRHAHSIAVTVDRTAAGVRVVETSNDPYVVKLLQAHASVVSAFLANGHAEMMKDHPLP
jgi:hypothetical protein